MVPIAGSAYTYAYATIGEFIAWIIGWDLILEYALSVSTVAVGWSGYFVSLANDFGIHIPVALTAPLGKVVTDQSGATVDRYLQSARDRRSWLLVSALLISGVRQSANANTVLVAIKAMVLVVFVVAGAAYVKRANLTPFIPANTGAFGHFGLERRAARRRRHVLRVHRLRRRDRPPRRSRAIRSATCRSEFSARSPLCTVLYIAVAIVLTGIVHYSKLNVADPLAVGIDATGLAG